MAPFVLPPPPPALAVACSRPAAESPARRPPPRRRHDPPSAPALGLPAFDLDVPSPPRLPRSDLGNEPCFEACAPEPEVGRKRRVARARPGPELERTAPRQLPGADFDPPADRAPRLPGYDLDGPGLMPPRFDVGEAPAPEARWALAWAPRGRP